jgi:hypothetical protein
MHVPVTASEQKILAMRDEAARKKQILIQQLEILSARLNKSMSLDKRFNLSSDALRHRPDEFYHSDGNLENDFKSENNNNNEVP